MKKEFILTMIMGLLSAMLSIGCDDAEGDDTADDGDDTSGGEDTGEAVCDINVLETFDTGIPAGWTVTTGMGGGSGSGSGSGTGSDSGIPEDPDESWRYIDQTTEDDDFLDPEEAMEPGYLFVGGTAGKHERLTTDFYDIGSCQSVSLTFDHFFDDAPTNPADRGELWINVDSLRWEMVGEHYNEHGFHQETVDLTPFITGGLAFQLRFQFVDETGTNYGWYLDNVGIVGSE